MQHLGSNLERLLRSSTRPVTVVNRAFRPIERFLVAFDGGPAATRALERVCESPLLKGVEAHVLTAGGDAGRLAAAADQLRAAGFAVTEHLADGPPEAAVTAAVQEHDIGMLVLGKSGHSRLRQLFIGSTTMALMQACPIPAAIFP
jgi:nucleotide-binding universal stress UspA family protein